jgi:hypothetical protein
VISLGLAAGVATGAMEDELHGLAIPGAIFTGLAALSGCLLAAIERTRRRTFLWLAIILILCNPFVYRFVRDLAWEVFGVLPPV